MNRAHTLLLKLLRYHALTRSQAAWWLKTHFGIKPTSTIYAARVLASEGRIEPEAAREVYRGRLARTWRTKQQSYSPAGGNQRAIVGALPTPPAGAGPTIAVGRHPRRLA